MSVYETAAATVGREHRTDYGQFGWSCSCGAGRDWPLAPYSRGRNAVRAHVRSEVRKECGRLRQLGYR